MLNYADYEALFNSGDDRALVERFFADDLVFTASSGTHRGKDGLMRFLDGVHDGIREVMRPQNVLQQGDLTFAEIDMDFHATKSRPDFPFKAMQPGDQVTVKFFVTYRTDADDKVVELKAMIWPPDTGVTRLPKLGAHPSQQAAFRAYAAAFSNADFDRFPTFYTDDVTLELGSVPRIEGRQGIVDFYRPMFAKVRETLFPHSVSADDATIKMDATTRFTALEDAPDFVVAPLAKGEYLEVRVFVQYELREGLISAIRVTRGGDPVFHRPDGSRRE